MGAYDYVPQLLAETRDMLAAGWKEGAEQS